MTYTPRGTAHEHILDVAEQLFYSEGVKAVGIDRIIAESGVAKMTFYKYFPSKDDLVVAYIQRRSTRWHDWFRQAVVRYGRTVQEYPLAIFDALEERFLLPDFRGCAFINIMVELANPLHRASQAASEHKQSVQQFIQQIIEQAHYPQSELLAQQFMLLMDGATVIALRDSSPATARLAKQIAAQLLSLSADSTASIMMNS